MTVARFLPLATFLFATEPAAASETPPGFEAAALAGYGVSSGVDVIGPGVGARVGHCGEWRFCVGAIGLVHFGSADPSERDSRHYSQSVRLELGYEIDLGPLDLRPALRAGATHVNTTRSMNGPFWSPDVGAGAMVLVHLDGPFIGFDLDTRFLTELVEGGDTRFSIASVAGYWVLGYRF